MLEQGRSQDQREGLGKYLMSEKGLDSTYCLIGFVVFAGSQIPQDSSFLPGLQNYSWLGFGWMDGKRTVCVSYLTSKTYKRLTNVFKVTET